MPEETEQVAADRTESDATGLVRDEPVDVTAEVVPVDRTTGDDESRRARSLVLRQVIERQLSAGQGLSTQLLDAATDVSVAVAHAPAGVVEEIRGGATLPSALATAGTAVRDVAAQAGGRIRTAVGGYVGEQAALPNAVLVGASDVAETVVRAQGTVTASALNAAFALATVAARGGDVRDAFDHERDEVAATADAARDRVRESVGRSRAGIRAAVRDDVEAAFANAG